MCPAVPGGSELASGGVERGVFAARERPVPSTKAKVLNVPLFPRGEVGGSVQLIIRSEKTIIGSAMMGRMSEHRRGNGRGENYRST